MAEVIGTTASIISIIQLSSEVVKYISGVSGATKERKRLRDGVRACEFILQSLKDDGDDLEEGRMWAQTIEALQGPDAPLGRLRVALTVVKTKLEPKKGFQKAFSSLKWPFDQKEIDRILSCIEREKSLLSLALTNDCRKLIQAIKKSSNESEHQMIELKRILACLQESQTRLQTGVDQLNQDQNSLQRRHILHWLTPVDYSTQQHDLISQRQNGTGKWLLDSVEFQAWLQTDKQTLFCPGIPGAGKTIFTAIVVDDLITRFHDDPNIAVIYLFCDFRRHEEQNAKDLILNLLKQLGQAKSNVPDSLELLYDQYKDKRTQLSMETIIDTLHTTATTFSRIFVIVDALDECQAFDGCRMKFLSEISNLQVKCNVNLFATSRNIPEIVEKFKLGTSLEIRASDEDVRMYLNSRLSRSESVVLTDCREEIATAITEAVDGMFLLAFLHFEFIKTKRTLKKVKDALKCLPKGLKAYDRAYDKAMERIAAQDPDSQELAENVLSWITCVKRRLTASELQHALAVELGEQKLDKENLPQIRDMISVCAGLVTVDDESSIIRLVHYTTQEYFERRQNKWFPYAEALIAKTCITYVLFDVFDSGFCLTDMDFESRLLLNPLYDYAARNWGHHARLALDEEVTKLSLSFLDRKPSISASSQACMAAEDSDGYSQKVPRQITGLHLAAYFGLSDIILNLVLQGNDPNIKDSYLQTPLLLAAANGHKVAVSVLIALDGIDINCEDKHGRTPLSFAAEGGHENVVSQLLTHGNVDLSSTDEYDQTPLSWATWKGHTAVVDLLSMKHSASPKVEHTLFGVVHLSSAARNGDEDAVKLFLTRIHPNSIDKNGRTPLAAAAECGNERILKLMLAVDAVDPDFKDLEGKTALMYAAENGHEDIVKLLLDLKHVDHNAKDETGRTPLYWAMENKHEPIFKLLLEKLIDSSLKQNSGHTSLLVSAEEANIVKQLFIEGYQDSSEAQSGQTLLSYAAEGGYDGVVNLLYLNGYTIHSKDKKDRTALSFSAEKGHMAVVKLLVELGANVESKDGSGSTPLMLAARNGHEAVVKLLLYSGAEYQNLLFVSAEKGHKAVIKLLLESGANVESKDYLGSTALMFAARNGHEAVVKLLVELGANVESKDGSGSTPLMLAARNGHEAVVKLLLYSGAEYQNLLFVSAEKGHKAFIKLLLELGANVESKDYLGSTALMFATQNGHEPVVKLLLESGANVESKDYIGSTPLMLAARNGHESVVKLLLERGANIKSKDVSGSTLLMLAIAEGRHKVVKLLLTRDDIDVNAKDSSGNTALSLAVLDGHGNTAQQLYDKGADMKSVPGYNYEKLSETLSRFLGRSGYVYLSRKGNHSVRT